MTEQLPQYELMVREYERSANVTCPDELKIAALVSAVPPILRLHIQMALQDERVELYEQVSLRWTADGTALQLGVRPIAQIKERQAKARALGPKAVARRVERAASQAASHQERKRRAQLCCATIAAKLDTLQRRLGSQTCSAGCNR